VVPFAIVAWIHPTYQRGRQDLPVLMASRRVLEISKRAGATSCGRPLSSARELALAETCCSNSYGYHYSG